MAELKCPHCGTAFTVDDAELGSIIAQIRDSEFNKDLAGRVAELKDHMAKEHSLELTAQGNDIRLKARQEYDAMIAELKDRLGEARNKVSELENKLSGSDDRQKLAVMEAVRQVEDRERRAEDELNRRMSELRQTYESEKEKNRILLEQKDEQIAYYKDMKARMSTKMVGESLEKHCEDQFNMIRMSAFPNAYFEKDNDARTGSKGDYIFREVDESGVEIISIMFEMKNEMDETATKHKNEDFFKELDKDRREKNCEYAVLVSMLESDSELYNGGIVDVSYKYDRMYVVRPQCFIPIITLLRNASLNSLAYKRELAEVKNQDIDISNFEDSLRRFKDDFGRNYELAHSHFDKAIDEIDKTIQHLEKVKSELMGSDRQLRIATGKVEDVSVKKLTKDNPTMKAKFDELKQAK